MDVTPNAKCETCGALLNWTHDHRDDFSGVDDGPYRAKPPKARKKPEDVREIRLKAWQTRRERYGECGHR